MSFDFNSSSFLRPAIPPDALVRHLGYSGSTRDEVVATIARIVDASGAVERLRVWRAQDRAGRHPGGAPAAIDDRAALVLWILIATTNMPLWGKLVADEVLVHLSDASRELLGIRDLHHKNPRWRLRCLRAIARVRDVVDPYPAPRKRSLTAEEVAYYTSEEYRPREWQRQRQKRLFELTNRLVRATWLLLPRDVRRAWPGHAAIDATVVPAFAKWSRSGEPTSEPDAYWWRRPGDHAGTGSEPSGDREYGWDLHLVSSRLAERGGPLIHPLIATAIAFAKPGKMPHELAVEMLTAMRNAGMPAGTLIGDGLYYPGGDAERFQIPVRKLGYENINRYPGDNRDIKSDKDRTDLGIKAGYAGAIQVEGHFYCPQMPEALINATINRQLGAVTKDEWRTLIDARAPYLLRRHGKPRSDGSYQMVCPAYGRNATAICPLKQQKREITGDWVPVTIRKGPERPDRICTQQMVTFPIEAGAKRRQDVRYGTKEWHRKIGTRNTIEHLNQWYKDEGYTALERAGRRRLRGRTAQNLLVTFIVVAGNIRKIVKFLRDRRDPVAPRDSKWPTSSDRAPQTMSPVAPTANSPPQRTGTDG